MDVEKLRTDIVYCLRYVVADSAGKRDACAPVGVYSERLYKIQSDRFGNCGIEYLESYIDVFF